MVGAIRGDEVEVRPGEFVGAVTVLMRRGMARVGAWIDGDRRRDGASPTDRGWNRDPASERDAVTAEILAADRCRLDGCRARDRRAGISRGVSSHRP